MLFDAVTRAEIDGLRRALGEPDVGKIQPHLTLVPPVNVRDVDAAGRVLRAAAGASPRLALELGPVATFLPNNPVAYLAVGGDVAGLRRLRDAIFQPPLERDLSWPFVPHVTVADGIDPGRIAAAPDVLGSYRRVVDVGAVHLLEEREHVWEPIAAFPLGPPAIIGRGGAPIELDELADEDAVTVTARRDGAAVGSAHAWRRGAHAWLDQLDVGESHRRDGVGSHLLAAVQSWAAARQANTIEVDPALAIDDVAASFLTARGWKPGTARLQRAL